MNNYLPLLQTTTLFAGLSAAELSTLLSRLGGSVRSYGTVSYTHLTLPTTSRV